MDYSTFTQCKFWTFSDESLAACRLATCSHAARLAAARKNTPAAVCGDGDTPETVPSTSDTAGTVPVVDEVIPLHFACNYHKNRKSPPSDGIAPLLSPAEELLLVRFYSGKIAELVGPGSPHPRLRPTAADGTTPPPGPGRILFKEIPATAAALFRRFYLSNSVICFDPRAILSGACWLATKTEDNTVSVRAITEVMKGANVPLTDKEVVPAELHVLSAVNFNLWTVHPYRMVRVVVDDVRSYVRVEAGRRTESAVLGKVAGAAATLSDEDAVPPHEDVSPASRRKRSNRAAEKMGAPATASHAAAGTDGGETPRGDAPATGGFVPRLFETEHLQTLHDRAMALVDDAVVSDLVLLHPPGRIAVGCLMATDVDIQSTEEGRARFPPVNFLEYVRGRFRAGAGAEGGGGGVGGMGHAASRDGESIVEEIREIAKKVRGLREGLHGCGNHGIDFAELKAVHKKLKKVRIWGQDKEKAGKQEKKEKKKKKRDRSSKEGKGGEKKSKIEQ